MTEESKKRHASPQEDLGASQSNARFLALMEHTADAIMIHDASGQIVDVNHAATTSLGYSREELLGMSVWEVETNLSPAEMMRIWERLKHEASLTVEGFQRRKDGISFPVEVRFGMFESDGRPLIIAIIRDLTERKQICEEMARKTAELESAKELNRLKDHFLSTISHELKTPLSLIVGYIELLEDTGPSEDLLAGIKDGSRRLTEHIDKLLDYSALIGGTLPLYLSEVHLSEIAQHACEIMWETFERKGIDLVLDVAPEIPTIRGDSRRLTQMLLELLDNAAKVTSRGGKIGIRLAPSDAQVRIDVWDTGTGITEQDFPRLWQAFSQLEVGDAFRRGGLGLGLTIVKKLVELHDGKVGLISQAGKGSTFSIYLPVTPARQA
ncbi:Alkaline phosphatase synthesis sensor protein PhoR [compost metagenome]